MAAEVRPDYPSDWPAIVGRAPCGLIRGGEPAQELLEASVCAAARTCSTLGAHGHGVHVSACCCGHTEALPSHLSGIPRARLHGRPTSRVPPGWAGPAE